MSPCDRALVQRLRAAGSVFAEDEAAALLAAFEGAALEHAVARRVGGEPLEWILGHVDFAGHRFRLSEGVFIPRQRSRMLVDLAIRDITTPSPRILDLCCGCGALGLAIRAAVGGLLFASDRDPRAVADARANGADAEIGDLFESVPAEWRGRVDALVCNAPYVPTHAVILMPRDSREFEERALVDGGPDGLDVLTRVIREAPAWLAPHGRLYVECGPDQTGHLHDLARTISRRPFLVTSAEDDADQY